MFGILVSFSSSIPGGAGFPAFACISIHTPTKYGTGSYRWSHLPCIYSRLVWQPGAGPAGSSLQSPEPDPEHAFTVCRLIPSTTPLRPDQA
jgi:hypothetical protein